MRRPSATEEPISGDASIDDLLSIAGQVQPRSPGANVEKKSTATPATKGMATAQLIEKYKPTEVDGYDVQWKRLHSKVWHDERSRCKKDSMSDKMVKHKATEAARKCMAQFEKAYAT